jgi:hypothetical protein
VSHFNHAESISRQTAAERLTDIAYALTLGGWLVLRIEGEQVRVPVPLGEEVLLRRRSTSEGDRVGLALELSWPAPRAPLVLRDAAPPGA